jgi:hypothetical protein
MSFDGPPTAKMLLPSCSLGTHDEGTRCCCICHHQTMISHLRPCCTPCPECGFNIRIQQEDEDDQSEA